MHEAILCMLLEIQRIQTIVLKPGSADLGLEPSRVDEKIGKVITQPTRRADPAKPGQKPGCNLLTFVFFLLKRRHF